MTTETSRPQRHTPNRPEVEAFTNDFIAAMFWAESELNGVGPDGGDEVSIDRLADREVIAMECYDFCRENADDILTWAGHDPWGQAGYDFYMTRQGHGVGFWEAEWDDGGGAGDRLTAATKAFGEFYVAVGGDGDVHFQSHADRRRQPATLEMPNGQS